MEQKISGDKGFPITVQDKAYFHSDTHTNLESTDVKKYLSKLFTPSLKRSETISRMVVGGILKK